MTLKQFENHRLPLFRQLVALLVHHGESDPSAEDLLAGWEVTPLYGGGMLFEARKPGRERLICVGPRHPKFMGDEDSGGACRGTWWWETDL